MHFIKHHTIMKKKEEITDGLTVPRREGDLDRLAHWRSGVLTDGGAIDRCAAEGSGQEVLVCRGRGRRCKVGGTGGGERRRKWYIKE